MTPKEIFEDDELTKEFIMEEVFPISQDIARFMAHCRIQNVFKKEDISRFRRIVEEFHG